MIPNITSNLFKNFESEIEALKKASGRIRANAIQSISENVLTTYQGKQDEASRKEFRDLFCSLLKASVTKIAGIDSKNLINVCSLGEQFFNAQGIVSANIPIDRDPSKNDDLPLIEYFPSSIGKKFFAKHITTQKDKARAQEILLIWIHGMKDYFKDMKEEKESHFVKFLTKWTPYIKDADTESVPHAVFCRYLQTIKEIVQFPKFDDKSPFAQNKTDISRKRSRSDSTKEETITKHQKLSGSYINPDNDLNLLVSLAVPSITPSEQLFNALPPSQIGIQNPHILEPQCASNCPQVLDKGKGPLYPNEDQEEEDSTSISSRQAPPTNPPSQIVSHSGQPVATTSHANKPSAQTGFQPSLVAESIGSENFQIVQEPLQIHQLVTFTPQQQIWGTWISPVTINESTQFEEIFLHVCARIAKQFAEDKGWSENQRQAFFSDLLQVIDFYSMRRNWLDALLSWFDTGAKIRLTAGNKVFDFCNYRKRFTQQLQNFFEKVPAHSYWAARLQAHARKSDMMFN